MKTSMKLSASPSDKSKSSDEANELRSQIAFTETSDAWIALRELVALDAEDHARQYVSEFDTRQQGE